MGLHEISPIPIRDIHMDIARKNFPRKGEDAGAFEMKEISPEWIFIFHPGLLYGAGPIAASNSKR
jgi:hypothetical protein